MRFGTLAIWILLLSSIPARAEIVKVRFAGKVTELAPGAPHPFAIGEAIWGAYAFDSLAPAVDNPYSGEQYPALRYFAIESAAGFYAQINWGTVIIGDHPNESIPTTIDQYRVVTLPPLIEVSGPFTDGPNAGNSVEDITTIAFDVESVENMIAQSQSLGFPGADGAFLNDSPLWILLSLSSPELLPSTTLATSPPAAAAADHTIGEIHFGPVFSSTHPTIKFSISELSIVPEPSVMTMATFAMSWLLHIGHKSFSRSGRTRDSLGLLQA